MLKQNDLFLARSELFCLFFNLHRSHNKVAEKLAFHRVAFYHADVVDVKFICFADIMENGSGKKNVPVNRGIKP